MRISKPDNAKLATIGRLQVASMIDVVFLLLIFFMTTTTLEPPESELTPALTAETRAAAAALQPQVVEYAVVDGEPGFQIGQRVAPTREALTEILRALPKEAGVFVKAPDEARVAWAAAALQACRDAGFEKATYAPAR